MKRSPYTAPLTVGKDVKPWETFNAENCVCPVCGKEIACTQTAISGHFRIHIKARTATDEDRRDFMKSVGVWKDRG